MYTGRNAETKRTNMLTCMHAYTHTHCCTQRHTHTQNLTHSDMHCGVPLWIRIHFCLLFPLQINTPVGRQTAVSVPRRLSCLHTLPICAHVHTHMHRHTHGCWCVMASAASLLTPHMLTEAYTSLLAALTIWHPTERHSHKLDLDRQARDGSKDKEVQWSDRYRINVT